MHHNSTRAITCAITVGAFAAALASPFAPSGATVRPPVESTGHPCFILQPRWNVALDGPVPRCGGDLGPVSALTAPDVGPRRPEGRDSVWSGGLRRSR